MKLELKWFRPIRLYNGLALGLIYALRPYDLDRITDQPGIYVFARRFGNRIEPLYIGQAERLYYRIKSQFNNLRLMRGIEDSDIGNRLLLHAEYLARPGQQVSKALDIIESAMIESALTQGYALLNKLGTKTKTHAINFAGNLNARKTFPRDMYVRAR